MHDDRELEDLDIEGAPLTDEELADGPGLLVPAGMDEGELLDGLYRDLRRGEHAKNVMVEAQMRRVIEASKSLGESRFIDGIGQLVARVPAAVYHHWGQRHGYEIWNNPGDLIKHLERLNPGFMVRSRGKTQVVVDGRRDDLPADRSGAAESSVNNMGAARPTTGRAVSGRRGGRWSN